MNEAAEVDEAPVVSGCKTAEVFGANEAPFDLVTMLIDGGVGGRKSFGSAMKG